MHMSNLRRQVLTLLVCTCLLGGVSVVSYGAKKIIHVGWDAPTPVYWAEHVEEIDHAPFDGTVFHLEVKNPDGSIEYFKEQSWSQRKFTWEEVRHNVEALQEIHPTRMRHNFVLFQVCQAGQGNVDWFDDFDSVLNNVRLAARVAASWRYCDGVCFDPEEYHFPIFTYSAQKYADQYSWEEYAAQARLRGRQVMNAFEEEYPGLTVFLFFGYEYAWEGSAEQLPEAEHGLFAPFLDGMFEVAGTEVKIVDGYERSYPFENSTQFQQAHQIMSEEVLPIVGNRRAYQERGSLGFGIFVDYAVNPQQGRPWHVEDPSRNWFSPEKLEASVKAALDLCDEYIWLYNERVQWWGPVEFMGFPVPEEPVKIGPEYFDAVFRARAAAGLE